MEDDRDLANVSSQGVREHPISKLNSKNEDLGDVYDHIPTKQTTDLADNKEVMNNNTMLNKRNRNKRHSIASANESKPLLNHG